MGPNMFITDLTAWAVGFFEVTPLLDQLRYIKGCLNLVNNYDVLLDVLVASCAR